MDWTDSQKLWELAPAQIFAAAEIQDGLEMIGSDPAARLELDSLGVTL